MRSSQTHDRILQPTRPFDAPYEGALPLRVRRRHRQRLHRLVLVVFHPRSLLHGEAGTRWRRFADRHGGVEGEITLGRVSETTPSSDADDLKLSKPVYTIVKKRRR